MVTKLDTALRSLVPLHSSLCCTERIGIIFLLRRQAGDSAGATDIHASCKESSGLAKLMVPLSDGPPSNAIEVSKAKADDSGVRR